MDSEKKGCETFDKNMNLYQKYCYSVISIHQGALGTALIN